MESSLDSSHVVEETAPSGLDIYASTHLIQDEASPASPAPSQAPYSAFTSTQKRLILSLVAFAGWFSSLSSFIYFPAIPQLSASLNASTQQINLTVTAYLIMSGIFPSIIGTLADSPKLGRRPVLVCALIVYVGANVGLALQNNFTGLFSLRMLQSAGISGCYAVTYGIMGDLFTPAERGGWSGVISFVMNTPPSIGPVISGLLLERWGWRSIFWFLVIMSGMCGVLVALFLPETGRMVVGHGDIAVEGLTGISKPLVPMLVPQNTTRRTDVQVVEKSIRHLLPNPLATLLVLRNRSTAIVVFSFGIYYVTYSCLQASLASLLTPAYQLSGLTSGLVYLPFGVACAIAAFATGYILNYDYQRIALQHSFPVDKSRNQDLTSFPIEKARLRSLKYSLVVCGLLIIVYGWTVQYQVHLATILVLQFLIGLTMQGLFTTLSTLLVDLHPDNPSTAQAASNCVRCEMAAGGLALLDVSLRAMASGWCFTLFAGLCLVTIPLLLLLEMQGLKWRKNKVAQIVDARCVASENQGANSA